MPRAAIPILAAGLAIALAVGTAPAVFADEPQAAGASVIIDDATTGTGLGQFEYSDGWGVSTGLPQAGYEGGTEHWANHSGPSFTLRFTGSRVHLYAVKDSYQGIYSVTVDGGPAVNVDSYSSHRALRQRIFDSGPLSAGDHTVVLTLTSAKNPASSRTDGQIDYAVIDPVLATGIEMDDSDVEVAVGQTRAVTASVLPVEAHDRTITWTSSDAAIATVAPDGTVTGVGAGRASITATSDDGGFTAQRAVEVHAIPASGITMDATLVEVNVNQSFAASATVEPADAADRRVVFSTADPAIAKVSSTGLVTGVAPGSTTLTAATSDGAFTTSRPVSVTELDGGLFGAVGDSNYQYVLDNSYSDYPRKDYADIIGMTGTSWSGTSWKGDREIAQLVLWAGRDEAHDVTLSASDLAGPGGSTIAASDITLNFIDTVLAGRGAPPGVQDPMPDVLGSRETASLDSGDIQPVWVMIDVPTASAAGSYTGTITAADAAGDEIVFDLSLEVLDATLPDPSDWTQLVDIWQNPYAAGRAAGFSPDEIFSPAYFDAMRPHYAELADIGQKVITTTIVDDPWASTDFSAYRSMVEWIKNADGSWSFDYTKFDAWVEFMMSEIGPDAQIDAYSLLSYAKKIRYTDAVTGDVIDEPVEAFSDEWKSAWRAALAAFGTHLTQKGWFDQTYLAADEVPIAEVLPLSDFVNSIPEAAGLKLATATNYWSLLDPRLDNVAKVSVVGSQVWIADTDFRPIVAARAAKGLITTIYNCTSVFPNSFTRSNPAEGVWFQWKTVATGTDGYLRWALENYNANPTVTTDSSRFESGDGFLVYPDASSVRFEKIGQGVRDAAKLRFLKDLSPAVATQVDDLLATMTDPDSATDPELGGMIDPGLISIPDEVDRLESGLDSIVRSLGSIAVDSIAVSGGDRTIEVGDSATLEAKVAPLIASDQGMSWVSSDPSVVTVGDGLAPTLSSLVRARSEDGAAPGSVTVTAVGTGTATLTVTSADGARTDTVQVEVVAAVDPVDPGSPDPGAGPGSGSDPTGPAAAGRGSLASTGFEGSAIMWTATALLVAGLLLTVIRRRRRRSSRSSIG